MPRVVMQFALVSVVNNRADILHVVPLGDLVDHEPSDECVCGPETIRIERGDGSDGWVISHHALDKRE